MLESHVWSAKLSASGAPRCLALRAELAATAEPPTVIALHPAAMTSYLRTINRLADTLSDHAIAGANRGSLVADFRALVDHVVVDAPVDGKIISVEIKGRLASLIGGRPFPYGLGYRW